MPADALESMPAADVKQEPEEDEWAMNGSQKKKVKIEESEGVELHCQDPLGSPFVNVRFKWEGVEINRKSPPHRRRRHSHVELPC